MVVMDPISQIVGNLIRLLAAIRKIEKQARAQVYDVSYTTSETFQI